MLETANPTTTERRTTERQAPQKGNGNGHRIVRAALLLGAAAVVATVALAIVSRSTPEPTADVDITSGFEYNSDATSGMPASTPVTGQYFGNSDEMFPGRDLTSGFEHTTDATAGRVSTDHVTSPYFGYSPELSPDH